MRQLAATRATWMTDFERWLQAAGIRLNDLVVAAVDEGERGLVAGADAYIQEDDVLALVPAHVAVHARAAFAFRLVLTPPCLAAVVAAIDACDAQVALAVCLALETALALERSPWEAWLRELPRDGAPASPVFGRPWDAPARPAGMAACVGEHDARMRALFHAHLDEPLGPLASAWRGELRDALAPARLWRFYALAVSRSFGLQPDGPGTALLPTILPVVDMGNHRVAADAPPCCVVYKPSRKQFVLRAPFAALPGQQVFITYGFKANDELLALYGFAAAENVFDRVAVDLADGERVLLQWTAGVQARVDHAEGIDNGQVLEGTWDEPVFMTAAALDRAQELLAACAEQLGHLGAGDDASDGAAGTHAATRRRLLAAARAQLERLLADAA